MGQDDQPSLRVIVRAMLRRELDVRPLLPQVKTPTLVIHCDRDQAVPPEAGRQLPAGIPGARSVSLPSANHLMLQQEPA
jgi:pimeloyl-ACP methyl ester carboxylesterase